MKSELACMTESAHEDIKLAISTISYMKEMWKTRDVKNTEKIPNELLEMKIPLYKMKNTVDRINGRVDIAEENIHKLKDIATLPNQNETQKEKEI